MRLSDRVLPWLGIVTAASLRLVPAVGARAVAWVGLDGPDAAWPVVLSAANELFPTLPVVGYDQGDGLAAAVRHGFEPVGPLRVWLHGR